MCVLIWSTPSENNNNKKGFYMANVMQLPNGKWRAQVRIKGIKAITKRFSTKKEAQLWGTTTERDIKNGLKIEKNSSHHTISFCLERYSQEQPNMGRSKRGCLKMLNKHLGKLTLNLLDKSKIVNYAIDRSKTAGGVTINMELTYLSNILNVAKDIWGIPLSNNAVKDSKHILKYRRLIDSSTMRDRRPTQHEIDQLVSHFKNKVRQKMPMADIILLAIGTGFRAGEIINLRWSDLDSEKKTILVRDRKHPKDKIGNNQIIPLLNIGGINTLEIIQRQEKGLGEDRIFPWQDGTISTIFPRACQDLGINDLRFHDLRHEFCSRMAEAGFGMLEIARCSGHRDINMLKRYVQISPDSLHQKANSFLTK